MAVLLHKKAATSDEQRCEAFVTACWYNAKLKAALSGHITMDDVKKTVITVGEMVIPFTWVDDMLKGMENAKTNREFAFYFAAFCVLGGLDAYTTASDVVSLGSSIPLTMPVRAASRKLLKEIAKRMTKEMIAHGVEKEAAHEASKRFVNIVVDKGPEIATALKDIRKFIPFKNESEMWRALTEEIEENVAVLSKTASKAAAHTLLTDGSRIGISIVDKSKTWLLNNLATELGDVGLTIYSKAVAEVAQEMGASAVRTGGDEIVVIWTGKALENLPKFHNALQERLLAYAKELNAPEKIKNILAAFGMHDITAVVKLNKAGKPFFTHEGTELTLQQLITKAQTTHLFKKLSMDSVKILEPLAKLAPHKALPQAAELAKNIKFDKAVNFRLAFNDSITSALKEVAKVEGKAVTQVERQIGGPSLLNLLGYSVNDAFTEFYFDALTAAFKKEGIAVKIYQNGPMSFGLFFEKGATVSEKTFQKVMTAVNNMFIKNTAKHGVVGVKAFSGTTKELASHNVISYVFGKELSPKEYELMKNAVAQLHINPQFARGKNIPFDVVLSLEEVAAKAPWVRTPDDLVHYLTTVCRKSLVEANDILFKLIESSPIGALPK